MLELIQKIKLYTEAGIILEHMKLFDELILKMQKEQNSIFNNIFENKDILDYDLLQSLWKKGK